MSLRFFVGKPFIRVSFINESYHIKFYFVTVPIFLVLIDNLIKKYVDRVKRDESRHKYYLSPYINVLGLLRIPSSPHVGSKTQKSCELHLLNRVWNLKSEASSEARCESSFYVPFFIYKGSGT